MECSGEAAHWFNPENDLALAAGIANYTPPKVACTIRAAGEALPLWYGMPGDVAICSPDAAWLDRVIRDFRLPVGATHGERPSAAMRPRPWGWSAYARRHFEALGFDVSTLPTPEMTGKMRELSHRRTAAQMAERLRVMLPEERLAEPAVECRTEGEVRDFLTRCPDAYLKSPWSGSGRGVLSTIMMPVEKVMKFAADSIRRQGSVMAERAYRKALDFAMLFECEGGECHPAGTSVFVTDERGAYTGNLLAPEAERMAAVARHVDEASLKRVRDSLTMLIRDMIAPHYTGVLGVDMLVCADGMLDAAVEVNLRTTMGYVAARFADTYLHPGSRGVMRSGHPRMPQDYVAEEGRLARGVLHLSPPAGGFGFVAEITPPPPRLDLRGY